jgi:glycosyltransferase involved in cell wall biosynthesis
MRCLFSIIIPCFNSVQTVTLAVSSILSQVDFGEVEIICVDDGSTDDTVDVLIALAEKYSCVKYYSNGVNRGVSYTRNFGIEKSCGDYVLFLDSDDQYKPGLFDNLKLNIKRSPDLDIISFGMFRNAGDNKSSKIYSQYSLAGIHQAHAFLKFFLQRKIFQSVCSVAIRCELIKKNNILFNVDIALGEDISFQIKCMSAAKDVVYLSEIYFEYYYNPTSVSNSIYTYRQLTCVKNYENVISFRFIADNYELKKYVSYYYQYMYFYELRNFIRANDDALLANYIKSDVILLSSSPINFSFSGFILMVLKVSYSVSRSLTLKVLKYI